MMILFPRIIVSPPYLPVIQPYKNKQQDRERPYRTAAVAYERQWNPYDGQQSYSHSDIDKKMCKDDTGNTVAVILNKWVALSFRYA
jgi:hypothetical protein